QPGAITPSGEEPIFLGSSERAATAALADGSCAANPYYLQFDVAAGEPFVFNNNIPLTAGGASATGTLFLPLLANQSPAGGTDVTTPGQSIQRFLPMVESSTGPSASEVEGPAVKETAPPVDGTEASSQSASHQTGNLQVKLYLSFINR